MHYSCISSIISFNKEIINFKLNLLFSFLTLVGMWRMTMTFFRFHVYFVLLSIAVSLQSASDLATWSESQTLLPHSVSRDQLISSPFLKCVINQRLNQ